MLFKILGKKDFRSLVEIILQSNEIIAPKKIATNAQGEPIHQFLPIRSFDEMDLDYEEFYAELDPGANAQKRGDDDECPYLDFGEVPEYPGGIGIATYVMDIGYEAPQEYGIYGFGRDITYPMYDLDPMADDPTDEDYWIFFVLHN